MANDRGHWNRAGRRSGGNRPVVMTVPRVENAEETAERERFELLRGIGERSPLFLIVGAILRYDDPAVERAMLKAGIRR